MNHAANHPERVQEAHTNKRRQGALIVMRTSIKHSGTRAFRRSMHREHADEGGGAHAAGRACIAVAAGWFASGGDYGAAVRTHDAGSVYACMHVICAQHRRVISHPCRAARVTD